MAGIYIHIPYCKKLCYYCDFHFSLNTKTIEAFIEAVCTELILQKDFFQKQTISTIYFGGGTPSVLSAPEIASIINTIHANFSVNSEAEVSFECNPEDISLTYAKDLYSLGINRISMGVQSFNKHNLRLLNRRHSGSQAQDALSHIHKAGFNNCTIDLIYGIPNQSLADWKTELDIAAALPISHLSSYALTLEPKTALAHFVKKGTITLLPDENQIEHFTYLMDWAQKHSFEHYEISNFAKNNLYSVHNTNYWKQKPYLGVGPSAHSFNGHKRMWNIAHNQKYIDALQKNSIPQQHETISTKDSFNEYIMTNLRTKWGVDMCYVKNTYPHNYFTTFTAQIQKYIEQELLYSTEFGVHFTQKGIMLSDAIIADLFRL